MDSINKNSHRAAGIVGALLAVLTLMVSSCIIDSGQLSGTTSNQVQNGPPPPPQFTLPPPPRSTSAATRKPGGSKGPEFTPTAAASTSTPEPQPTATTGSANSTAFPNKPTATRTP